MVVASYAAPVGRLVSGKYSALAIHFARRTRRLWKYQRGMGNNVPLGIGLIGAGMIGQGHAYALRLLAEDGDVRPVAVTDFSADAVEAARRICPFERVAPDAQAVIDDPDVDAVVIVTPTTTHRDLVLAVVAAGKPFLCEKPLATRFDIVTRDVRRGRGVGPHRAGRLPLPLPSADQRARAPRHRAASSARRWATRCATTSTGRPATSCPVTARGVRNGRTRAAARCSNTRSTAPTSSRGCSGRPTSVYARTRNVFGYDVEDTAVCTIEHASGVVGTLISIFNGVRGREERRLEVFFERGAVEVTTDFLVGAREDSFLIQRPDQEPERLDVAALRDAPLRRRGHRPPRLLRLPLSRGAGVRRGRCARSSPRRPAFADALAAHALVDAGVPVGRGPCRGRRRARLAARGGAR